MGHDGRGLGPAGRRGPDDPARSRAAGPRRGSSGPTACPSPNPRPHYRVRRHARPAAVQPERIADRAELTADADFLVNIDRKHYWNFPPTDAEGRITLVALIPGALYRISDYSTAGVPDKGYQVRRDFTVKPGETLDLGDILIEKPGE